MLIKKYLSLFSAILVILLNSSNAQEANISSEIFGRLPEISHAEISPDGSKILFMQNYQGRRIVVTKSLKDPSLPSNGIPTQEGEYNWARWSSNDTILASIRFSSKREGRGGLTDTVEGRLVTFDWKGQKIENPINLNISNVRRTSRLTGVNIPQFQDDVIDMMMDDPDHILIQMDLEDALAIGVYRLNLKTKDREKIINSSSVIQEWRTDEDHIVRYGEGRSRKTTTKIVRSLARYRKSDKDGWRVLFEYDELKENPPFNFVGFSNDPSIIFISKLNAKRKKAFYKYNVDSKQITEEIASNDDADINSISIVDGEVTEYTYIDDSNKIVRLSDQGKRLQRIFTANFPGELVKVVSETEDAKTMVLRVSSPTNPGSYYILDLNNGSMDAIAYNYSALDYELLSPMESISYEARDGLEISGYLSLPRGEEHQNHPTIIMPHGGPWWVRDHWDFDYWVQFLTARGYAVLQMNFRGSSGFGTDFTALGYQEWGRKMLEDINDGTKWVIEAGYADADKICIMGGSYGGYASLQAIVKDPSLYKCSVSFAPITDLSSFMRYRKRYTDYSIYENFVVSDEWTLDEASPAENIESFNVPVLLLHGDIDRSVRVEQSRDFYKVMKKADKDIKYIEFEGSNHFLSTEVHRIEFLKQVEKFLKKNL
tara:strand:- start:356 stop:2323 length:1968 start_codon:yes stop_codon:yes gene_type:complete